MHIPSQLKSAKHVRLVVPAVALLCVLVLSGCEGNTTPATGVGTTTAILNGQGSCSGGVPTPCSWYWRWGTNGNFQYSSAISGPAKATWSGTLSYQVTGLTPGTTYSYELCGEGDAQSSFICAGSGNGISQFTTESSGSTSGGSSGSGSSGSGSSGSGSSGSGSSGSTCTSPVWSSSEAEGTYNTDPNDGTQNWWVNNDAWNGSAGPQTINVCNASSWSATSNQKDVQGAVETYPDTEYDVGGRNCAAAGNGNPCTTKPISGYSTIGSTFSESYPTTGDSFDAAYDLWLNNWSTETMIWNQWGGDQNYWGQCAEPGSDQNDCVGAGGAQADSLAVTLGGVAYHFLALGPDTASGTPIPCTPANESKCEYMFFRDNQVASGSVDILAAYKWMVSQGFISASDVPTQLEYGVEIVATSGTQTFPMNGLTFNAS